MSVQADSETRSLTMYLSIIWKSIFDGIDRSIGDHGTNVTLVSYDNHNLIEDSRGTDGKIDADKLCINIGAMVDCSLLMKDKLVAALTQNHISFAAVESLERFDGKETLRCYFAADRRDKDKFLTVVNNLNQALEYTKVEPRELASWCQVRGIDTVTTLSRVEPEIYGILRDEKNLDFPYCAKQNQDGSFDIMVPPQFEEKLNQALINAVLLCSGYTRESFQSQNAERERELTSAMTKVCDNQIKLVIVDSQYPNHLMRSDREGVHILVRTADGEHEIGHIERSDKDFQQKVYNTLSGYAGLEVIPAMDKDLEKKLEDLQERTSKEAELSIDAKIEYYKRSLTESMKDCIEKMFDGRLKDNAYVLNAAIDNSIARGQESLKLDLQTDVALNNRIISGGLPESVVDLSDVNGEAFTTRFCESVLGTSGYADIDSKKIAETKILETSNLSDLAEESREVKLAVIKEIQETIREVATAPYEYGDLSVMSLSHEVERENDREQHEETYD